MAPGTRTPCFARLYNKALAFYHKDDLDDCIKDCQEILDEQDCPPYHRIKTLVLIGACLEDVSEVGEAYAEAKRLWLAARAHHSEADVNANELLEELKVTLDELRGHIEREVVEQGAYAARLMPEIVDPAELARIQKQMEEETCSDEDEDPIELEEADWVILGEEDQEEEKVVYEGSMSAEAAANAAKLSDQFTSKLHLEASGANTAFEDES